MSFRCGFCSKAQPANTSPVMVVTEWRNVFYPERKDAENKVFDPGGRGREIVSAKMACEKCVPKETTQVA